jgi:hypothetical protein
MQGKDALIYRSVRSMGRIKTMGKANVKQGKNRGGTPPVKNRFKKGESGNPNGRPVLPHELRDMIGVAGPSIIRAAILKAKKGNVPAMEVLLKRYLPSLTSTEVKVDGRIETKRHVDLSKLTPDELKEMIRITSKLEGKDGNTGSPPAGTV